MTELASFTVAQLQCGMCSYSMAIGYRDYTASLEIIMNGLLGGIWAVLYFRVLY
jgi:hypothetical protein